MCGGLEGWRCCAGERMPTRNTIGPRIRELRRERQMALDELATAAGISASHLSRIERGMTGPSFPIASRLAAALGVSANDLATIQRDQAETDMNLVAVLVDRGLQPAIAEEITAKISTPARRALLEAITDIEAT